MAHHGEIVAKSPAQYKYDRDKRAASMRMQVITFSLMIFLTLISFLSVGMGLSAYFVAPIILLLAGVQVVLQLYYFMHMNEKDMGVISFFMWSGILIAFITVLCFVTIIWWQNAW